MSQRFSFVSAFLLLILAQFFLTQLSFSQNLPENENADPKYKFLPIQIYDDLRYLTSEPDFYFIVGGLGLMPSAFPKQFKMESPEYTEQWGSSQFADNMFELGETIGDGRFPLGMAVTSWTLGKLNHSEKWTSFGTDLLRSQIINGLATATMKKAINRPRPTGMAYSYPSGHTSSTFATAGIIYHHFGKTWGIPAFVVSGYVGLSRLQEGKHYLSDVVAGAILGSYISLKLARRDNRSTRLSLTPKVVSGHPELILTYKF